MFRPHIFFDRLAIAKQRVGRRMLLPFFKRRRMLADRDTQRQSSWRAAMAYSVCCLSVCNPDTCFFCPPSSLFWSIWSNSSITMNQILVHASFQSFLERLTGYFLKSSLQYDSRIGCYLLHFHISM